jgi:hypothetical protein
LATGINDTGGKFAIMTPAANFATNFTSVVDTGVNDTGGKFAAGVNDTGSKFATAVADTGGKQWD